MISTVYWDEYGRRSDVTQIALPVTSNSEKQLRALLFKYFHVLAGTQNKITNWGTEFSQELERPWTGEVGEEPGLRIQRLHKFATKFAIEEVLPVASLIIHEENQPLMLEWQLKLQEMDHSKSLEVPLTEEEKYILNMEVDTNARLFLQTSAGFTGIAGGQKFFHGDNLFFKFSKDYRGLYGGDEFAIKSAEHEMKSLQALIGCGIKYLNFPLFVLVHYLGRCLTCQTFLPISTNTIVYGSADGAKTIYNSDPEMSKMMERVAEVLNLKKHVCSTLDGKLFELATACDVEGHLGTDGRYYVVDCARLFPPEPASAQHPGGILYRLLRPEFVRRNPVPLSSDAFSNFASKNDQQSNEEVSKAFELLFSQVIPNLAIYFESLFDQSPHLFDNDLDLITKETHLHGVNLRYLGHVRFYINKSLAQLSGYILAEIIARTQSRIIRREMRKLPTGNIELHKQIVCKYLNLLFGVGNKQYWISELRRSLLEIFPKALFEEEMDNNWEWSHVVTRHQFLLGRLQSLLGLIVKDTERPLLVVREPFAFSDIVSLKPRVKYISMNKYIDVSSNASDEDKKEFYWNEINRRKLHLGEKHAYVATSLENFAQFYCAINEYPNAAEKFLEALDIRRFIVANTPIENMNNANIQKLALADTLRQLAVIYRKSGKIKQGFEAISEAQQISKTIHGACHIDVLWDTLQISQMHKACGESNKAGTILEDLISQFRADQITTRSQEFKEKVLWRALIELAPYRLYQGFYLEAHNIQREALEVAMKITTENSSIIGMILNHLSVTSMLNHNFENAEQLILKSVNIRKEVFGPNNNHVAHSLITLSFVKYFTNHLDEAKDLLNHALNIYSGKGQRYFPSTLANLARVEQKLGNYLVAKKHFKDAHRSALANSLLANSHTDRASLFLDLGKPEKALHSINQAISIRKKLFKQTNLMFQYKHTKEIRNAILQNDKALTFELTERISGTYHCFYLNSPLLKETKIENLKRKLRDFQEEEKEIKDKLHKIQEDIQDVQKEINELMTSSKAL